MVKFNKWQVFGVSILLMLFWCILILQAYTTFQNTRLEDPLATLNTLFPFFFLIIASLAMVSFYVAWKKIDSWKLQLILLTGLAFVLWLTPYLMSGFIKEPDSIWHTSIGLNIGEVLSGNQIMFSEYAMQYPGSYIISNFLLQTTGLDVAVFATYVFPPFYIFIIVLLMFIVSRKFLGPRYCFMAALISIPAIHYLKLYPCPSSIGLVLILTLLIMILFHRTGMKNIAFLSFIFLILIVTYPIYPIYFIGAIGIVVVSYCIYHPEKMKRPLMKWSFIRILLVTACIVGASIFGSSFYGGFFPTVVRAFKNLFGAGSGAGVPSGGLIYPEIYYLNLAVYAIFGAAVMLFLFLHILSSVRRNIRPKDNLKLILKHHGEKRTLIFLFIIFTGAMTLLLGMVSFTLIERGLTLLVLFCSAYLLSSHNVFIRQNAGDKTKLRARLIRKIGSRHKWSVFAAFLLFLTITQPIIGYSIDAYTSFPQSENHGLEHLANTVDFDNISISISMPGQLAYYVDVDKEFEFLRSPIVDVNRTNAELIVYRQSGYFYTSMRVEKDFENNSFTQSLANINAHTMYNKVYDTGTIEIFIHN